MRLFVALELPVAARAALAAWSAAPELPEVRPVPEVSLHLTLCFLGEQPDPQPIADVLAVELGGEAPLRPVEPVGTRWLPQRRPRVLAVELSDPGGEIGRLSARVHGALGRTPEHRQFLPPVTVARVRGRLAQAPAITVPGIAPFMPGPVTLVRSLLGRGPARYERLAIWPIR